jgi:hypothetical protein
MEGENDETLAKRESRAPLRTAQPRHSVFVAASNFHCASGTKITGAIRAAVASRSRSNV